ncbi:glycerate kinase [Actinotalea sp. M2MS4P-6]|uniref:glycerate kinase n=1 Tax=Actinotalea sp. M2MS4P-6 TaxID=2983762 RepID=UPI0021E359CC|nr:glycerate kinase [Actinotalea sp. M2MS4P-6]MCV2396445.1 glycerate kinase [Actinotalea sp. M2MS4P-6]
MHVLVAPDRFGTALSAAQVATAMADGWAVGAPADVLDIAPLGDGGPGMVEAVHRAVGGELVPRTILGVGGTPLPVVLVLLDDGTVVVEVAQVLGRAMVPGGAPTGSLPAAALLDAALDLGPRRLVVGVGGLAAHDAGSGLLAGLGLPSAALRGGGAALPGLVAEDLAGLAELDAAVGDRWSGVDVVVAVDTEVPLLGLHGASALLSVPDATVLRVEASEAQQLERAFGHWVHLMGGALGPGRVRAAATAYGAGAGGGLAFALALLGARTVPGAEVMADLVGLRARVAHADLVLTATTVLDPHVLHDSAVATCSALAAQDALPTVVVTGESVLGRREWAAQGLSGVYALADGSIGWQDVVDPASALRDRTTRVARTWSR